MNNYSQKINQEQGLEIKFLLQSLNAAFDVVQYSFWRAKTSSFQVIYYTSGKILIQGKEISEIVNKISVLCNKNNTTVQKEYSLIDTNGEKYIGTDESGKGDFFGPLIVAGVQSDGINNKKFIDLGIKDSKKLNDNQILKMAGYIKANSVHSVIVIMPKKYNELYSKFNNLNKLLAWAHSRAIENILEKSPCNYALADKFGDESLIQNALMNKGKKIILKQCVRAEADIIVAAASVLARAEFVKRMKDMSNLYETDFSKGASQSVKLQAKSFIQKYSCERLNEIAKMHFKTAKELQ